MKALILVDIQNDFTPAGPGKPRGALAVPDGDAVIDVANRLMPSYGLVIATQDWHPADHKSFASRHPGRAVGDVIDLNGLEQVLWPDHCVQGSAGAELCEAFDRGGIHEVVRKGTDPDIDSYSGFFDNGPPGRRQTTGLDDLLRSRGVGEVHVMGLATDYCVKFTALDAISLGYDTHLIEDGVRGVDLNQGDCDRALDEMRRAGVNIIRSGLGNEPVRFYRTAEEHGCFSNFAPFPVRLDGKCWPTTEHYFQAQKFDNPEYREKIRTANSPAIAARLGRSRKIPIRKDWESIKDDVMRRAVRCKVESHETVRRVLLSTGDRKIVEQTTRDNYWGCGSRGTGKNMLGLILMEIRAQIRDRGLESKT